MTSDSASIGNYGGTAQSTTNGCLGCGLSLLNKSCVEALGGHWHSNCFVCHDCGCALSSWYIYKDGNLYCKEHYWKLVGDSCNKCGLYITGPIMLAGQHRYHPECFTCISCHSIIGLGEAYCFVERSKLYCDSCYRQVPPCSDNDDNISIVHKAKHSIQMIEVPASHIGDLLNIRMSNGRRLSIDVPHHQANNVACINVDSVEVTSIDLKTGDRILEVNCCPVKELEQSLKEFDSLLKECRPVSLTIERDHKQHNNNDEPYIDVTIPSSPTSTTSSENDGVGSLRRAMGQKTKNYLKRRSTLPSGYSQTDAYHIRSDSTTHDKHSDINRSSSLKPLPRGQRVFRPSDLEYGATLGSGFFGVAKKVTDKQTGEVMVIKELLQYSKEAQESFLKEVWVLRSLNHPNVLRFIGVLYKDKTLNIVTEFAPGGTLHTRILNSELPWSQRIKFAEDIACGMAYLHSKDIVHRDLNSSNCFLQEDDSVVVADFGLSRSVASREATSPPSSVDLVNQDRASVQHRRLMFRRLRCKTIVGNPFFMAPEMMHGHSYDEKVDVFSFGIIICEIIGRVDADPEYIPRSNDFGLDVSAFSEKYGKGCPEEFLKLAVISCNMDSMQRPPFDDLHQSLERLYDEKFANKEKGFHAVNEPGNEPVNNQHNVLTAHEPVSSQHNVLTAREPVNSQHIVLTAHRPVHRHQ